MWKLEASFGDHLRIALTLVQIVLLAATGEPMALWFALLLCFGVLYLADSMFLAGRIVEGEEHIKFLQKLAESKREDR